MKIWKNSTGTKALVISHIGYWEYTSASDQAKAGKKMRETFKEMFSVYPQTPTSTAVQEPVYSSCLLVVIDGHPETFYGEEADDIYNILRSQKEVL